MDQELSLKQIEVIPGSISFKSYQKLKKEALKLSERVSDVKVTEENVKESKKLVAAVAKRIKELQDQRILIKKTMLEPYEVFEEQVKEIVQIVNESEDLVRTQIRELEEQERETKRAFIEELFNKRISLYSFKNLFQVEDFLQSKHLNKTSKIESVEKEMVEFLEKIEKDLTLINTMENKERLLSLYLDVKDITIVLTQANQEKARLEQIRASQAVSSKSESKSFTFTVYDEKDFKLIKMFMDQNNIKFHAPEVF